MIKEFRQAKWDEPVIFELGHKGRIGHRLPDVDKAVKEEVGDVLSRIPSNMRRKKTPNLPEISEVEVVRHFTRLSQMNWGVDCGIYPLGSCTMKYSPRINEVVAELGHVTSIHPYQNEKTVQGALEIMYKLERWFAEITGTHRVTLQPAAGAHGEFAGIQIIRTYHELNNQLDQRTEIIVPDSAHGTNPASAVMGGFGCVIVPTNQHGIVDIDALQNAVSENTAGLMLTNPNTLGLFEREIADISKLLHSVGALLYYDGANLNAILGKVRPGDMGFDIVHINVHKTFSTPHGGGGPGAGPLGVSKDLEKFLPVPTVEFDGKEYYLDYNRPHSIGKVKGFYGNFAVLVRSFAYILSMGSAGLEEVAESSVLNANYIARKLLGTKGYELPYDPETPRKHEVVFSATPLMQETHATALNVSKRLLDYGVHAPTNYFPLIVHEALMIEPTETEPKEELNHFVDALKKISEEAFTDPDHVLNAPRNTSVSKLDDVKAAHPKTMCLSWRMKEKE
ncbi:MAG: aminomethyl-transferring glycine dehydrogenase subunit GcvPB [Candidatus Hodarchaeota archaeon]